MNDLFLTISSNSIDWARAQFALTAIYHWLFVPLTLGLAVVMGIVETCWYRTRDTFWRDAAQFWQRLFGINFAMGVATGIILEFEFGTNWSNYSWFVGDIFGAPLAVEGIVAFFMESTFVAVMYFGWKKVSPGFHLAATWLTGLGATISAWWALSPFAIDKFCHTVISAWIIGAIFTVAVSCWYLMKKREIRLAKESIKIAAIVGLVASLGAAMTGHKSAQSVADVQPMKLAAMEALYDGGYDRGLTVVPGIEVPYALSFMATNDFHGFVPGINDIMSGYTRADGTEEPSIEEKMVRGRMAIEALAAYRKSKAEGAPESVLADQLNTLNENMPYFGYGYVKDKEDIVPPIWVNFWAFRIMVGVGCLFILYFLLLAILSFKIPYLSVITRRLLATVGLLPETKADCHDIEGLPAWHYWLAVLLVPLAYIASESGWLVAEFGRQPWTIQDMLPTWVGVSDIESFSVALTFFLFLFLFTLMLCVEINIMLKQIKKGPQS